ncbi:hypothetical protein NDK50_18000 [Paraburkholderia bryophila]|uniref:hypothetical protein n=1 Tax=Paraburkholderia bryophila TaxID=420952 RepID=UPI00234A978B|nr:hypothetical protein [Paraburkholderia bryophila]WCM19294.1 hypothetical protein NDK50_18000 [Paraburkholderia bryophila]
MPLVRPAVSQLTKALALADIGISTPAVPEMTTALITAREVEDFDFFPRPFAVSGAAI